MKRMCAILLVSTLVFPNCAVRTVAHADRHVAALPVSAPDRAVQDSPDVWRQFAQKLPIGSTVKIRTTSERFSATLLVVDETGILVKPKTRLPEPTRRVTFDRIEQLEIQKGNTSSAATAAAVGTAVGVGAFFGLLLIFAAIVND